MVYNFWKSKTFLKTPDVNPHGAILRIPEDSPYLASEVETSADLTPVILYKNPCGMKVPKLHGLSL